MGQDLSYRYDSNDSWHTIPFGSDGGISVASGHSYIVRHRLYLTDSLAVSDSYNIRLSITTLHSCNFYLDHANFYDDNGNNVTTDVSFTFDYNQGSATYIIIHLSEVTPQVKIKQIALYYNWSNNPVQADYGKLGIANCVGSYDVVTERVSSKNILQKLIELPQSIFNKFADTLSSIIATITSTTSSIVSTISSKIGEVLTYIFALRDAIINKLTDMLTSLVSHIVTFMQNVVSEFLALPSHMIDALHSFFVPSSADVNVRFTQFKGVLEQRFGCVYQSFGFMDNLFHVFVSGSEQDYINLPDLYIAIPWRSGQQGGYHVLEICEARQVRFLPQDYNFGQIVTAIKFFISFVCSFLFVRQMLNVFNSIFSTQESESLEIQNRGD